MIEHVVLFKLKADTPPDTPRRIQEALHSLRGCVPGMLQFQVTENFADRSMGFGLVLFSRFVTREALAAYSVHPAHQMVVETVIRPVVAEVIAADGHV